MAEAAHVNALRILAAFELNKRLAGTGVDVFACHPGVSKTEVLNPKLTSFHLKSAAGALLSCPPWRLTNGGDSTSTLISVLPKQCCSGPTRHAHLRSVPMRSCMPFSPGKTSSTALGARTLRHVALGSVARL